MRKPTTEMQPKTIQSNPHKYEKDIVTICSLLYSSSEFYVPTFRNTVFHLHGFMEQSEPKRKRTTFRTRRKFEIKICFLLLFCLLRMCGARGGAVGWGTALQAGRSRVRFPMVPLEFIIDIILLAAPWPWGWLSLWQKWVSGIFFLGGKGGRCVGLTTLPLSYADCLEIWELQPPGTPRRCSSL